MSSFRLISSTNTNIYREVLKGVGEVEVKFSKDDKNRLFAEIVTPRLVLRSVKSTEEEYNCYASLFSDKKVMQMVRNGETKTRDEVVKEIDKLAKRWIENNPFSRFTIHERETKKFAGHVDLEVGDSLSISAGRAELRGAGGEDFWKKGYGFEVSSAVINSYALAIREEGYCFEKVFGTAKVDNKASCKIFTRLGMEQIGPPREIYGGMRYLYEINVNRPLEEVSEESEPKSETDKASQSAQAVVESTVEVDVQAEPEPELEVAKASQAVAESIEEVDVQAVKKTLDHHQRQEKNEIVFKFQKKDKGEASINTQLEKCEYGYETDNFLGENLLKGTLV